MALVSFNINSAERASRAEILTRTTTNAALGVDSRDTNRLLVVGICRHHCNRTDGTMSRTVATADTFGNGQTIILNPYSATDVNCSLFGGRNGTNCTGRTNLRAKATLRTAVAAVVLHYRLHKRFQLRRRTQHAVRASGDTQLACRAVLSKMTNALRTGRHKWRGALGQLLFGNCSKSAIDGFLLGSQCRSRSNGRCRGKKSAPRFVDRRRCRRPSPTTIRNGVMRAIVQAIHTRNAARIVDGMLLGVDTRRFALACTNAAIDTFIGVDNGLQQRIFR